MPTEEVNTAPGIKHQDKAKYMDFIDFLIEERYIRGGE